MKGSLADFVMKKHSADKASLKVARKAFTTRRAKGGLGVQDVDIVAEGRQRWSNGWYAMLTSKQNNPQVIIHPDFLVASKFKAWYEEHCFEGGLLTNLLVPERNPMEYGPNTSRFVTKGMLSMLVRNKKEGEVRGVTNKLRDKLTSYYSRYYDMSLGKFKLVLCADADEAHFIWAKHHIDHLHLLAKDLPQQTKDSVKIYTDAIQQSIDTNTRVTIA